MSKTYFGRCAAVGIAGLTAMSSLAIVASAATQTSMLYELSYTGIGAISLKGDTKYGNGNTYCNPTAPGDLLIGAGFNTDLTTLLGLKVDNAYKDVATGTSIDLTAGEIWNAAYFADIKSYTTSAWKYQAYGEIASAGTSAVALKDPYLDRGTANESAARRTFTFMTESERTSAKNTMIAKLKSDYTTLATKANTQFRADIEAAKKAALAAAATAKQNTIDAANAAYEVSGKTAADAKTKNDTIATANNRYNAISSALNTSASKITSEFNATFNANNFVYDYKSGNAQNDTFGEAKCPVSYGSTIGGISGSATATYTSVLGTAIALDTAMYNIGATAYNTPEDYVFAGELQSYADITTTQLVGNGTWRNYQIIDNNANSGGNSGSSSSDKDDDNKTDTTTWYPDSSSYRAPSEVSYLGKNGHWYTSASAATAYGGGYTGTSKNSNFSAVNDAANGKAIYFDSTTGTYSTTSTAYSYKVKEATATTNDDPYYTYFFNKNNTTTTTAPAGSPALSGSSKYAGWTNISAYITNRAKSGATYTVNMNEGTVVPAAVLAAAKAKNITLVFVNDNGSKVTVKPGKVSVADDLNVAITYNVKDVKSSLVTKAKKVNSAVSSAQVRIGTEGSIGGTETVTVKFSTKRSGCTVKAYRLTSSGSLKLEAKGTIASTGRVNLNIKNGGSYLLVVC
ncbi:MAG: hypothetical protein ACI4JK_05475 [Oscillospiraceae bacterium]